MVTLSDDLLAIGREVVVNGYLPRVNIGLDFFDASINRVAAWVIGRRAMLKSVLIDMLEPTKMIRDAAVKGDYTASLPFQEEVKNLPCGAVWDYHCTKMQVPIGAAWLGVVRGYEHSALAKRV